MTLTLSEQDKVDVRRHCGYGALGAHPGNSLMFWQYFPQYKALEYRLENMIDEEVSLVQGQYLPNLNLLEQDLSSPSIRDNLDTERASVWSWNQNEIGDRIDLYNYNRRLLCAFFQIPEGPFFVGGGGGMSVRMVV